MDNKHGNLSINSENIFPIIKKWLYSDHDIFYRELISNGCDAITKLKKLDMMGEYQLPADYKPQIQVTVNPDDKTLTVTDNGLGMTAEEVEEYINQKNIRTRRTKTRLSDISVLAFILRLWLLTRLPLIRFLIKKAHRLSTGPVTAARNLT